jgi:dTDP-4-dehydrorhamnose 3,5-epimerase-like enzyme
MVAAGAVITKNVPPNAIVAGNPGRIVGYVSDEKTRAASVPSAFSGTSPTENALIPGVHVYELPIVSDLRGSLSFAQHSGTLPFVPRRYFIVYNVSSHEVRGEHAHRTLHQFLVCVKGSVRIMADNGATRRELVLSSPGVGVHIPPMVWASQYNYSADAVLLVLASDAYSEEDYIRDYDTYVDLVTQR